MTDGSGDGAVATRAAIERYLGALGRGDPDEIAACVAEDFHNEHTAALGHSLHGRTAYRERLPGFLARFTELRYEPEDWLVVDDRAAVPYRMRCTYVDDGTAHPVEVRGMFRFRVRDGLITHRVDYWDSAVFEGQIDRQDGSTR